MNKSFSQDHPRVFRVFRGQNTFPKIIFAIAATILAATSVANAAGPAPFITHAQFAHTLYANHFTPLSTEFEQTARRLSTATNSLCAQPNASALQKTRTAWTNAMIAWERLNAIPLGPLVERRSARAVDFWPTRPARIEAAVASAPANAAALESIGAPAKGLPALEWLLWSDKQNPSAIASHTHCRYGNVLAEGVVGEAEALSRDFQALAAKTWDEESDVAREVQVEFLNQTVGGLEQLRLKKMEKPDKYPRTLSGTTVLAWRAQYGAIKNALSGPFNDFLLGRGLLTLSATLHTALTNADQAFGSSLKATPTGAKRASKATAAVKRVLEDDVAKAIKITIGFSDSDGD